MNRTLMLATAAILFGLGTSASVYAATQTISLKASLDPNNDPADGIFYFESPVFNTVLGTLTGVSFTISGLIGETFYGQEPPFSTLNASISNSFSVSTGGLYTDTNFAPTTTYSNGSYSEINNTVLINESFASPANILYQYGEAGGTPDGAAVGWDFASLAKITDLSTNTPLGGYGLGSASDFTFSGDVQEIFTYTPVPEPTSVALLGVGLFGIGLIRRRKGGIDV